MKTKIFFLFFFTSSIIATAQVKLTTDNKFQVGYSVYTPLLIGNYASQGYNYGTWGIEQWNNGLNLWKPWPCPNSGNYKVFIRDDNGFVGIGKIPSYMLDVNGDIATYGTLRISSDARLKTNINSLTNCMVKINKLNGKSYHKIIPKIKINLNDIKDSLKYKTALSESQRVVKDNNSIQLGLLADEVKQVLPELVDVDSSGYLTVDYIGLIPVIIEALKEQNLVIDSQNEKIAALEKLIKKGNGSKSTPTKATTDDIETSTISTLDQNAPNPFNKSTIIGYDIPDIATNASLYIYNMNGEQIKNISINQKGKGSVTINGSELRPGMYLYSLVVDNELVDTKRMILTQ